MVKHLPANAGDTHSVPGLGRPPRNGNPLQDSCLENPMDRGPWGATKSQTRPSTHVPALKCLCQSPPCEIKQCVYPMYS